MNRKIAEEKLAELPIAQFEWITPGELSFSERIRTICETECPMYGKTWACPPGVGAPEECREKCLGYENALLFTTLREVNDIADIDETLATRAEHEEITHQVESVIREQSDRVAVLSTEACAICEECTYPDAPCRFPEKMYPCVESHCIITTDIAEKYGIEFYEGNIVTWFSLVFFD